MIVLTGIQLCRSHVIFSHLNRNVRFTSLRYSNTLSKRQMLLPSKLPCRLFKRLNFNKPGKVEKDKLVLVSKSELKRLYTLAKEEKIRILGAIASLGIYTVLTMTVTYQFGKLVDYIIISSKTKDDLIKFGAVLVGLMGLFGVCIFARIYLMMVAGEKITLNLRRKVFDSILKQEVAFFDKYKTGELVNRLSVDASLVSQSLTSNLGDDNRNIVLSGLEGKGSLNGQNNSQSPRFVDDVIPLVDSPKRVHVQVEQLHELGLTTDEPFENHVQKDTGVQIREGDTTLQTVDEYAHLGKFYMSPKLATFGMVIVPPIVVVAIYYGRFVKKITRDIQDELSRANSIAQENISNIRTVKAFSNESRTIKSYSSVLDEIFKLAVTESFRKGTFNTFTGLTGQIMFFSVIFYGGVLVKTNAMTFGELSSFLMYMMYMGVSIMGIGNFYSSINKSLGSSLRIWEIIDRVPAIPVSGGIIPEEDPKGHIKFENVYFSYPTRSHIPVLEDLNLEISEGSVTAIVGSSGSGKSTIASLMLRLYDPDSGVVKLDGVNINELDPQWMRNHIGFVGQEPVLFSGSVRDNILYGANDPSSVTDEELFSVSREANCFDFITKDLPKGFDTEVGERGVLLSGGQKQRVAIARALIKNPKILLLDEATSALDSESERLVQEATERIMKGRTVLTIAHRLSTIKNADEIIVLDKGRVIQKGTYKQLLEEDLGLFKKLIKHQAIV